MAFNIKNAETDALLRELVALTGEDLTAAVTRALRERLERAKHAATFEERKRHVLEVIERAHRDLPPDGPSYAEIMDEMYDEGGLPR